MLYNASHLIDTRMCAALFDWSTEGDFAAASTSVQSILEDPPHLSSWN